METELVYDCEALIRNLKIKQALKLYQEGFKYIKKNYI